MLILAMREFALVNLCLLFNTYYLLFIMLKTRLIALTLFVVAIFVGYFALQIENTKFPYKFGLDIAGGAHLVYRADTSGLNSAEISDSMLALRDIIEKRVNLFGVTEPLVQTEAGSLVGGQKREQRLIVELPGVTDIGEAIAMLGKTPLLEFKIVTEHQVDSNLAFLADEPEDSEPTLSFQNTGITGRLITKAQLQFDSSSGEPAVLLTFNKEGKELFAKITKENVGQIMAIFLDGIPISTPVIREEIKDGQAQISGGFTPQEAKLLARDINYGALPVPIELISTQTIGASIGEDTLNKGVVAGAYGLLAVMIFLILWYRLPGFLAAVSLIVYISLILSIFKLIPITLTAAGIAGFILSIGMAVDANILIFERIKEEIKERKDIDSAVRAGFARAWLSIRDSNISSIITAVILFWFGTSLVEGFALTFGVGVLVSMFTAITITRAFLFAVVPSETNNVVVSNGSSARFARATKFLFGSGFSN